MLGGVNGWDLKGRREEEIRTRRGFGNIHGGVWGESEGEGSGLFEADEVSF